MPLSLIGRYMLVGMLGFVSACVAHEAIGHGGACLATGGQVVLLTSVFFRCKPGLPVVDAAGLVMNLAVAGAAWLVLARFVLSAWSRLLLAFVFTLNATWGAGYLIYSSTLNTLDWAYVLRELHAAPLWAWRVASGLTGLWLYRRALRAIAPQLPSKVPLLITYGSAGAIAALSVVISQTFSPQALSWALQESLGASVGVLFVAFAPGRSLSSDAAVTAALSPSWLVFAGVPIILVFLLLQGRGFSAQ